MSDGNIQCFNHCLLGSFGIDRTADTNITLVLTEHAHALLWNAVSGQQSICSSTAILCTVAVIALQTVSFNTNFHASKEHILVNQTRGYQLPAQESFISF